MCHNEHIECEKYPTEKNCNLQFFFLVFPSSYQSISDDQNGKYPILKQDIDEYIVR